MRASLTVEPLEALENLKSLFDGPGVQLTRPATERRLTTSIRLFTFLDPISSPLERGRTRPGCAL